MKIFTHTYRVVIFRNGRFCWETKGWVKNEDSVSRLWRWNRFKTWVAHLGKDFEYDKKSQMHLHECEYCKKDFKKWLAKHK